MIQSSCFSGRLVRSVFTAALAGVAPVAHAQAGFLTSAPAYVAPVGPDYSLIPILSVGDRVPRTSASGQQYQMIGIPDGMGGHANTDGTLTLFLNHELRNTVATEPVPGEPLVRGAFISKFIHAADGSVLSGDLAYSVVYAENVLVGPAPRVGNSTPAFSRFCSGSLAWQEAGFDRPIYFAGEESAGAATFDGRGGQACAVFDDALWTLPKAGRMSWENAVIRPEAGRATAMMCMEDGEVGECQLYLYVGTKDRSAGAGPLRRNGLDNGALYVFASNNRRKNSEVTVQDGSVQGKWVLLPNAEAMTDVELEAAADAVGAFAFDRVEDGAFRPGRPNEFYFVTTGGGPANQLGRLYRLDLNPDNLLGPAKLSIVYNADSIIAAGGDVAISPDNIDVSSNYIMIQEDGTAQSRVVMAEKERNGNIWRLDLWTGAIDNVAELVSVGRDGRVTLPGVWESSGVIDASRWFGADSWLVNVQAHPPTAAPAPNTAEDGQILLMRRNN